MKKMKLAALSLVVTLIAVPLFVLPGCGKAHSQDVEETVRGMLKEKYGIDVDVTGFEEVPGGSPFYEGVYNIIAEYDGQPIKVLLGKQSGELKDDFARYLYDGEITKRVERILQGVEDASYTVNYWVTEGDYDTLEKLDSYLRETDTGVKLNLGLSEKDATEAASEVYELAKQFRDAGIQVSVDCAFHGEAVRVTVDDCYELDLDSLVDKFRRVEDDRK